MILPLDGVKASVFQILNSVKPDLKKKQDKKKLCVNAKPVCVYMNSFAVAPRCLSRGHVIVAGWEDEDVLVVGYTEEPTRKRRKVTDEGVRTCVEQFHKGFDLHSHSF